MFFIFSDLVSRQILPRHKVFLWRKVLIKPISLLIKRIFPPFWKTVLNKNGAKSATLSVVATGGNASKKFKQILKRFMKNKNEQKLYFIADVRCFAAGFGHKN